MTREEVDQLKGRVVGRTVTWGNCEGVVEDVTLVGADALSLSGFSGLDVKVATYFRLRGDGQVCPRRRCKHLGRDGARAAELRAARVRRSRWSDQ